MRLHRPSRRSSYLFLFGIAWIAYGLAVKEAPDTKSLPIYSGTPMVIQGWAWIGTGALSLAGAVVPRFPRPVGFTAAGIMPTLWAVGFFVYWITDHTDSAWQAAVIWVTMAIFVIVTSGDVDSRPSNPEGGGDE